MEETLIQRAIKRCLIVVVATAIMFTPLMAKAEELSESNSVNQTQITYTDNENSEENSEAIIQEDISQSSDIEDEADNPKKISSSSHKIQTKEFALSSRSGVCVDVGSTQTKVFLKALSVPESVRFVVRSQATGKVKEYKSDDAISVRNNGTSYDYTCQMLVSDFKVGGKYTVKCYTDDNLLIGESSFSIARPTASLSISKNDRNGTFIIKAKINSKSEISSISANVSYGSRSKTYKLTRKSNNEYQTKVSIKSFGKKLGTYKAVANVSFKNGIVTKSNAKSVKMARAKRISISKKKVVITKKNGETLTTKKKARKVYVKKKLGLYKEVFSGKVYTIKKHKKLTQIAKVNGISVIKYKKKYLFTKSGNLINKLPTPKYSARYFKHRGVIRWNGWKWTWYSSRELAGSGLRIPGRHVDSHGYICDKDGYMCIASNQHRLKKGTVVRTPFGKKGKVYDCGCAYNTLDVYTNW